MGGWEGKHADGTGRLLFVYVDGKDADLDPVLSMGELAAGLRAWMWCPTRLVKPGKLGVDVMSFPKLP